MGAALGEATYTGTMSLRRWLTGRWPAGVRSHSPPEHRCQLCHVAIAGTPVCALVADDTVTAAGDTCLAGRRLVTACSRQHLTALLAQHRAGNLTG